MRRALLMMSSILLARMADSEILMRHATDNKVDEPIPLLEVSSVVGYQAKLPCDLTGPTKRSNEAFMVFWYKSDNDGTPIYSVDGRSSSSLDTGTHWSNPNVLAERGRVTIAAKRAHLLIDRLMPEDAGIYRCRIDFRNNPTRNQRVNLTVIIPPQSPVIYTNDRMLAKNLQPLHEDSELMLMCEVTGGSPPPRVTWHWNGRLIDETFDRSYDVTVNTLDMNRVTRDLLSAQLICKASNTKLVQPTTAEIIVDVNLKPLVVNITNKAPHLSALGTYEIECISSGSRPETVITWWKGTHQVKHMARNYVEGPNLTRSVLSYVPTIEDDGKYLTCRAENPMITNSALEDKWHLIIHYVPVVTIKLGSNLRATDINEGDDVYFECEVKANPRAYKLAWFKDGREIHRNASANVILPGDHSLVLQGVTRASAGEYACMAANDEGKATSRPVTLDVMYAPVCKDGTTTQVVGALKHETISLVCGVQSKPPPTTFRWTFNNSGELMNVPVSSYVQVKPQHLITTHWHGSRLNYTPTSDMDYGTIACQATNAIGAQKVPCLFQIIVAGKPASLQNCSAVQSTGPYAYRMGHEDFKATDARDADWLIVRCNEGFDGGLPITSFELEVYSDENVYHVNTIYINHTDKAGGGGGGGRGAFGPIFEVPGLEPGRNYRLLLYAVNAKGRSDPVVLEPVTLKGVAMYTTGRDSSGDTTDYSFLVACFAGGVTAICIVIVGVTLTLYRRRHPHQSTKTQTHVVHYANSSAAASGSGADVLTGGSGNSAYHEDRQLIQQHQIQLAQYTARQEYEFHQRALNPLKDSSTGTIAGAHHPLDVFARTTSAATSTTFTTMSSASASRGELVGDGAEDDPDVIPSSQSKPERRLVDAFEPNYASKPERIKDFEEPGSYHQYPYPYPQQQQQSQQQQQQHQPQKKDSWLQQNGGCQIVESFPPEQQQQQQLAVAAAAAAVPVTAGSPTTRPSTLPVHRTHDIYTRSLRVQESCI